MMVPSAYATAIQQPAPPAYAAPSRLPPLQPATALYAPPSSNGGMVRPGGGRSQEEEDRLLALKLQEELNREGGGGSGNSVRSLALSNSCRLLTRAPLGPASWR